MSHSLRTALLALLPSLLLVEGVVAEYVQKNNWRETLMASLGFGPSQAVARALSDFPDDRLALEAAADWIVQDEADKGLPEAVARVLDELGDAAKLRAFEALVQSKVPADDPRFGELYLAACEARREKRLAPYRDWLRRIVFSKHFDMGGSHYAYTEGQSDAQAERHFRGGTALCVLELDGLYGQVRTLVDDPAGVIRDPDVSYDGQRILFAWKKHDREDDYHLYEMNVADQSVRQLTDGLGYADYEGAYLPDGNIIFNSTRCMQIVDCWWTEVSNLFICGADGKHLRQLSFDQVHTNFPTVTHDGRVIYTRWDYNDRGQIYPQGLFQTKQHGTGQTEFYGNNSFFPTTVMHARSIPGTTKVLCVFSGHHTQQYGLLGILDPSKGRQENQGAQLIAPVRDTPAVHVDAYGRNHAQQFQYPYPLSETACLVTFRLKSMPRFAVYFMTIDGQRELLVSDPKVSSSQPIPLRLRPVPSVQPNLVDYRKTTGTVYLHNIYAGPGLAEVPRGAIKTLRVVALEFRAAGVGSNGNSGPAGGAMISTPISIQGAWDVKKVLGTAEVHDDGSACFVVPARTPLYFQALDEQGQMVQSMRSWMTVQPGEAVSCVGCHEHKNSTPPVTRYSQAMTAGPQKLEPFYGPPRGFSFVKEIQPILDRHCVRCHNLDKPPSYASRKPSPRAAAVDLKKVRVLAPTEKAQWRYSLEQPPAGWTAPGFDDSAWPYGPGGFGTQGTPGAVVGTQWDTKQIWIRRTFELPADFRPAAAALFLHHDEDVEVYLNGKLATRKQGHVTQYYLVPISQATAAMLKPGTNALAAHCRQTGGGQFVDVGLVETQPTAAATAVAAKPPEPPRPADVKPAFSLKGVQTLDGGAQRKWSDSYRALADRQIANWINAQSAPPMLPPYHAGASQSRLIQQLREGHNGVKLSREELDRFIVWIDLLVPYVGDYTEAMAEQGLPKYQRFLDKRSRWHAEEAENIAAYLQLAK